MITDAPAGAHPSPVRRRRLVAGTLASLGLALAGAGLGASSAAAAPSGPCTDPEGVTVVVDKTDLGGEVEMGCATDLTSGTTALQSAGFTDTRDAANLICAIDALPDPCPAEFTGSYWAYWTAPAGGEWEMAMVGPDDAVPTAGAVEGWRYNDGSTGPSVAAPAAPSQEAADEAATSGEAADDAAGAGDEDVDDGTTATSAEQEPTAASGPSPVVIAGIGVVALLAVAALVISRRRSAHGPAGQD